MKKLTKKLLKELKDKWVYHGSPKFFDLCKPNQAKCATKNSHNEQFAIYASYSVNFAILFCFDKKPLSKNCGWKTNGDCATATLYNMKIDETAQGYLYCFNKNSFIPTEPGSVQCVSKIELAPEIIYVVDYKMVKHLFQIINYDFPEPSLNQS